MVDLSTHGKGDTMKRTLAAISAVALLTLVSCSADADTEQAQPAPRLAAATDCGSPTPTETSTPTETPTETPTPTETEPPTPLKVIGMSAPSNLWSTRLAEVGPCGVEARRIFADLTSNGRSQSTLIEQAVNAGMIPIISYKAPSAATAASGGYDAWMTAVKTYLTSLGAPVTATYWHEPHGDMTAAQFQQGSQRFLDRVQSPSIKVGPILNGWLMDNQVSTFASYTNPTLLAGWDFVGLDSYQPGTTSNPDNTKMPGRAVPLAADWLADQGYPDMPVLVGEYNGFTEQAIRVAGETMLSTPTLWIASVWNSGPGGLGTPLSGARLQAFKDTKADPRALHDPACTT